MDTQLAKKNNILQDSPLTEKLIMMLRTYLSDSAEDNTLIAGSENDKERLLLCLVLAVDDFNRSITPITAHTLENFPSLTLLMEGAAIQSLKQAIFKYIRNSLQYNDGGVNVSLMEKSQEYETALRRMSDMYYTRAQRLKEAMNLEQCYGGVSSEYMDLYTRTLYTKGVF